MTLGSRNFTFFLDGLTRDLLDKNKNIPNQYQIKEASNSSGAGLPTYLGLGATSASDGGGQGAGTTAALVAHLLTQMD